MQEKEIDLKLLFYRCLCKWRKAVIFAIIVALLTGAFFLLKDLKTLNNTEKLSVLQSEFEIEYSTWKAEDGILKNKRQTIMESQARQEEYNEKSLLMKIDPLQEYVGSMSFYVDSNYQIMPNLTYQNIDYTNRIMLAYSKYMNSGNIYDVVLEKIDFMDEIKYIKEVLKTSIDYSAATIDISVITDSKEHTEQILNIVSECITEKSKEIKKTISKHDLNLINQAVYEQVDFGLETTQKANKDFITKCSENLQKVSLEIDKYKKEAKPVFKYSPSKIAKNCIKKMVIGGIVGLFVVFGYVAFCFVLTGKLSDDSFWKDAKIYYLGAIWEKENKKKIDALIDKFCGIKPRIGGFSESSSLLAENIAVLLKKQGLKNTAIIGTENEELSKKAASIFSEKAEGTVYYAGNILKDAQAIKNLENCDSVIFAATEDETLIEDILREKELLLSWGKNLLGGFSFK